jgi:prolipoprotein diacylglyceryltransferase
MSNQLLQDLHKYLPYLVALIIFALFMWLYGAHVGHSLRDLFREVKSLATGHPFPAGMNFVGGILLFILVIVLFADAKFDFIYAGSSGTAVDMRLEHVLFAALVFYFRNILSPERSTDPA